MERHAIDEARAFEMLREHSRVSNRKLVDLAAAVVDGHRLLPKQPPGAPAGSEPGIGRGADRARPGGGLASRSMVRLFVIVVAGLLLYGRGFGLDGGRAVPGGRGHLP